MDHLENRKIDALSATLYRVLINQVNTTTALDFMQKELEKAIKVRKDRANSCGRAEDCLECFQLARCVREQAEQKALITAQWGGVSEWDKE